MPANGAPCRGHDLVAKELSVAAAEPKKCVRESVCIMALLCQRCTEE